MCIRRQSAMSLHFASLLPKQGTKSTPRLDKIYVISIFSFIRFLMFYIYIHFSLLLIDDSLMHKIFNINIF